MDYLSLPAPVACAAIAAIGYWVGRSSRQRSQSEVDEARRELKRAKAVAREAQLEERDPSCAG